LRRINTDPWRNEVRTRSAVRRGAGMAVLAQASEASRRRLAPPSGPSTL